MEKKLKINLLAISLYSFFSCQIETTKDCIDENICYKISEKKEVLSDSLRIIFYRQNVIGKEIYLSGDLKKIEILDSSKLFQYYESYRHWNYVGSSLFINNCYGCHQYYPDIVKELMLKEDFSMEEFNKSIFEKHGRLKLNHIEAKAIYEYIRPKQKEILTK